MMIIFLSQSLWKFEDLFTHNPHQPCFRSKNEAKANVISTEHSSVQPDKFFFLLKGMPTILWTMKSNQNTPTYSSHLVKSLETRMSEDTTSLEKDHYIYQYTHINETWTLVSLFVMPRAVFILQIVLPTSSLICRDCCFRFLQPLESGCSFR